MSDPITQPRYLASQPIASTVNPPDNPDNTPALWSSLASYTVGTYVSYLASTAPVTFYNFVAIANNTNQVPCSGILPPDGVGTVNVNWSLVRGGEPSWSSTVLYEVGDIVSYAVNQQSPHLYLCLKRNGNQSTPGTFQTIVPNPLVDNAGWKRISPLPALLAPIGSGITLDTTTTPDYTRISTNLVVPADGHGGVAITPSGVNTSVELKTLLYGRTGGGVQIIDELGFVGRQFALNLNASSGLLLTPSTTTSATTLSITLPKGTLTAVMTNNFNASVSLDMGLYTAWSVTPQTQVYSVASVGGQRIEGQWAVERSGGNMVISLSFGTNVVNASFTFNYVLFP